MPSAPSSLANPVQIISLATSVFAAFVAALAAAIGVVNFLRERPRVRVELELHVSRSGVVGEFSVGGEVRCSNVGRRPVYIRNVWAGLIRQAGSLTITIPEDGRRLTEGGPPRVCPVFISNVPLNQLSNCRGKATDSAGKTYRSSKPNIRWPLGYQSSAHKTARAKAAR